MADFGAWQNMVLQRNLSDCATIVGVFRRGNKGAVAKTYLWQSMKATKRIEKQKRSPKMARATKSLKKGYDKKRMGEFLGKKNEVLNWTVRKNYAVLSSGRNRSCPKRPASRRLDNFCRGCKLYCVNVKSTLLYKCKWLISNIEVYEDSSHTDRLLRTS